MIAAFILLVLVQWLVPGKMIWEKGATVSKGKAFRFATEPVDPSDPFRGRYIVLNFEADTFRIAEQNQFDVDNEVYVLLESDAQGFARIKNVSVNKPANEHDYVKAHISVFFNDNSYVLHIIYPFEIFYLEEAKAPKAELDYFESMRDSTQKTYALVKVYNGDAVIENVFINGKPLVK